jgi:membrane dipeptidase
LSVDKILGTQAFEAVEYVDGLENPADFPNIVRWLVRQGYADADIAKVIGGNVVRVLTQVWVR